MSLIFAAASHRALCSWCPPVNQRCSSLVARADPAIGPSFTSSSFNQSPACSPSSRLASGAPPTAFLTASRTAL